MDPVAETLGARLEPAMRLRDTTTIQPIRLHAGDVLWLRRNMLGMIVEVWPIPREWVHPQPETGNYPAEGLMLVATPHQEGAVPVGFYVDRKDLVTCEFGPPGPAPDPLRWKEPPLSPSDAFAADSDADDPRTDRRRAGR